MHRIRFSLVLGIAILLSATFGLLACNDEKPTNSGPEMVTIRGIVRNIETALPASGIRVTLLGTSYSDAFQTGTDGAYEIDVPKGSNILLRTDDWDTTTTDVWTRLINVDVPTRQANTDMIDWPIHSCPQTSGQQVGSLAIWDHYLQHGDQNNGDRFVPTTTNGSGGAITMLILHCAGSAGVSSPDMTVTSSAPEFPIAYMIDSLVFPNMDTTDGPDIVYPAGRTTTDNSSWVCSWGDPAFTGTSVTLTITDTDAGRGLAFTAPFDVPVRPGTLSLILASAIDSVANQEFLDFAHCAGWLP